MIFSQFKRLKQLGILSMNARNADYILQYNNRALFPMVDDKLKTKDLALANDICVPELYKVVNYQHEISDLQSFYNEHDDFVIKPAQGSGGDGILVITGKRKSGLVKASGEMISFDEVNHHISNVLTGMYSLGGQDDKAIMEYRVLFDPVFQEVSYQGVPDIRMIVFCGFPVMGMLRLPTRSSQGKANLHQGAVGVGLDLATGCTLRGTWLNEIVDYHPDTGQDIAGLQIPYWDKILNISAKCYEMTGLGYLGVDLVLDRGKGPLMLELNARPGLAIQIANQAGLAPRLQKIEEVLGENMDADQRIAFSVAQFKPMPV